MKIYHITQRALWEKAQEAKEYAGDTLATQGFIHCSTLDHVGEVANQIFNHQEGLVILCIKQESLFSPVKYENLEGGRTLFPHIYGKINLEAVEKVVEFPPNSDGTFSIPDELLKYHRE